MHIISQKKLKDFFQVHPYSKTALEEWHTIVKRAQWSDFNDVKKTFNSADYVGSNRFVFNIMGNQYRIVGLIIFKAKLIYIRFVGTHKEYDKIVAKEI